MANVRSSTAWRTSHLEDSHLVSECRRGSESAWSALIAKYQNLIFSIPVKYGFSQEDSADIFQAVCIDLLAELPRLRRPDALPAWLIQVTRNKCFHRKRQMKRHSPQAVPDCDADYIRDAPQDLVAKVQQEQLLREALAELTPRCQQLVHMLFFETPRRPYQQVARDLRLAPGSIGFIRRRCLDQLRRRMEKMGFQ